MLSILHSCALSGLDGQLVEVEVNVGKGHPDLHIVGLADLAIQESKKRIKTALQNVGLPWPYTLRIIVNLAPADVKKEGPSYDLPIALGILFSTIERPLENSDALFVGELSLTGKLRHTTGILAMTMCAKERGYKEIFVPAVNAPEASLIDGITVYAVENITDAFKHLLGSHPLSPYQATKAAEAEPEIAYTDLCHIRGQSHAKRALEIAASGGHNCIFSGSPGAGKTLLAKAMPGILPAMQKEEVLEVTKIYSVAGKLPSETGLVTTRPFRSPHHSASGVALVGGGRIPKPGEVSLAHRGVLFLDEFTEFPKQVLDHLRQPIEDGVVTISRASGSLVFPARFTLVAAYNPCPCGFANDPNRMCTCTPASVVRYQQKLSGPIMDRMDLYVDVPPVSITDITSGVKAESSAQVRERVTHARERMRQRLATYGAHTNAELSAAQVQKLCPLADEPKALLSHAMTSFHLSARAYYRIIKVAQTIGDLEGAEDITEAHIAEALQYRYKTD